jgi:hypothetical protein
METFSEENWHKARKLLEEGNFEDTAAALVGVSRSCWLKWKRAGRELLRQIDEGLTEAGALSYEDSRPIRFVQMIDAARHEAVAAHIRNIKTAGTNPDRWQASAWYLERTNPARFGKKDSLNLRGAVAHASLGLTAEEEEAAKAFLTSEFPGLLGRGEEDAGSD